MTTSDGLIRAIKAGVQIDTVSAAGRTSDGLIRIGQALIISGSTMKVVDSHELTSDGIIKIHQALAGKVSFGNV